ncbi:interferon-induced very large GTPase 1-like [Acipenser oxyrinchus oxyrinchus]|uniref:Interferon-induced very large GTPase 1-like n=1 Tax=Acipenser oxyrinchus oxyrinchus TaxID=40147 RepID=A0AAD8CEJ6_ACIOX|nr:interferon-induced very large GTPase 1-like [Acipenser oxyrinchus oxyrinchus]
MEKETSEGEHQKESDQDRKELEKKLQDVGIDPHIWLPRLRGHLNITRAQALQYVGFKDYQKLQHYCEHEWEKEALQKLLNIQEKRSQSKKRQDDQSKQSKKLQDEWSEAFKKRQQEARSALNELQQMQEKGRNRNDGIVKEKEEQLQRALQGVHLKQTVSCSGKLV